MRYFFIYDENYNLTMPAVIIDARQGTALSGQIGDVIKAYTDAELKKVVAGVIPYKIETEMGNLAGYITVKLGNFGNSATVLQKVYRVAFQSLASEIDSEVAKFIAGGDWAFETLEN